jgi:GTP-binding protein
MEVKSAEFLISSTSINGCPAPDMPEYAFIGRSNVGKSSLINMLTNKVKLAKTSGKPGKTQLINHFIINNSWYLTDLPGFGYAKVSKVMLAKWDGMIKDYLVERENLMCVFVLVDSRHEQQKVDRDLIEFLGENGISFVLVFTKTDKISQPKLQQNLANYRKEMLQSWDELPRFFMTSAEKKQGREEILSFIEETNMLFEVPRG